MRRFSPAVAVVVVSLLLVAVDHSLAAKLPSYFKPCRRSDPKLNECVLKHGREAIPFIVQGDAKYGIPKLDPLIIEKIVVGDGKVGPGGLGITFTCDKCKFHGLKDVQARAARLDLKKRHMELEGMIPRLEIKGKYTASGKVLVLPIEGEGNAELVLTNLEVGYKVDFDLKKGKDGKDHVKLKNPRVDFKAKGFSIKLTNLFKGDRNLGNQMNVFLNENWEDVLQEFGPAVSQAVSRIVTLVVNNISEKVPYEDILPK